MIKLTVAVGRPSGRSAASAAGHPGPIALADLVDPGRLSPASSGFLLRLNTHDGRGIGHRRHREPVAGVNLEQGLTTTEGKIAETIGLLWERRTRSLRLKQCSTAPTFTAVSRAFPGRPASFEQAVQDRNGPSTIFSTSADGLSPDRRAVPALPAGVTATNVRPYLMGSIHEDDVSLAYLQSSGKEWQIGYASAIGAIMAADQRRCSRRVERSRLRRADGLRGPAGVQPSERQGMARSRLTTEAV